MGRAGHGLYADVIRLRPASRPSPGFREARFIFQGLACPNPPLVDADGSVLLDELQLKREKENQEAERHRHRRDDLNDRTRGWVEKRDNLNAQVRALVEEATQHRIKRDELNAQVKVAKEERDLYNKNVNEILERLNEVKRRRLPRGAIPLSKLRRDLKALEFKQMTSVLSADKERALIEEMARV